MQTIHAENVDWNVTERGVKEAGLFATTNASEESRIDLVEVPPGSYIPAHRHAHRTEFLTILLSAGAQMRIGDRVFRPTAGQVFQRDPGEVLALTNDTPHPFRYSVTRFRYEEFDVEWLKDED